MLTSPWFVATGLFGVFLASCLGVELIRRFALTVHLLDVPNVRSSHQTAVPRGGGAAIVLVTLGIWLPYSLLQGHSTRLVLSYLSGAVLIALVSGTDDLHPLPFPVRLSFHCIAALVVMIAITSWQVISIPGVDHFNLRWIGPPLTLVWIVGLTNAYNFMDGIDGMAASESVVAGSGWLVLGVLTGQPLIAALGGLVGASSLGFLTQNWSPARIFMGDVGSAFLGYTFAILPVLAARHHPALAVAGPLLLWPFLFDTAFTLLGRVRRRENVFSAHRQHLYQRLVVAGRSHSSVALIYVALAGTGLAFALLWRSGGTAVRIATLLAVALLCLSLWLFVHFQEQSDDRHGQLHNLNGPGRRITL